MDGGAWQATVHGIAKSQTQLSDFTSLNEREATLQGVTPRNRHKNTSVFEDHFKAFQWDKKQRLEQMEKHACSWTD